MTTRLRESTADRISNLPDGAIERILVFLPIKDAAKTSLLSRDWRHRWRSIPQLVFDDRFAPLPEEDDCGNIADDGKDVVLKIYEALLTHDGLLTKFELSIPEFRRQIPLDLLILHLSRKAVQELALLFEDDNYPKLHSSLFSPAFPLKRLKLKGCEFKVPSGFAGFNKLTLLELEDVVLPDDFYQNFLPCCPLLEELRVIDCTGEAHVFVSPSLKVLLFHSCLSKICFKYTPLLSVVSVLDTNEYTYEAGSFVKDNSDMVDLFASLPALQHLNLGIELLLFLADDDHVPYKLPKPLHNLRFLEVPRILLHRLPQARVLVCLIMSAPNLKRLTIRLDDSDEHPPSKVIGSLQKLLEAEDQLGFCCLQHLEEVNIHDSRGMQVELDLVRFVLATAPVLRRINIQRKEKLSSKKALKFLNEMIVYKRISKEAEIKYV
ncbi:unnamed protein product [Linum tenue]|uniref:F-box domain-containing protein n=1 Tax=Linum tenue TaxID=586396 RepID=A0AAV0NJ17_9ROSI|nr:unnamed protein product [Linum tenue]